jgi:hypothetical protein
MVSIAENEFVEEFTAYFNECGEYEITMAFDLFYENILGKQKIEELFKFYFPNYDIATHEELLYDKLYSIVETAIVNDCESEADTDEEN